jgi:predicted nucleic acid-binding protein
VLDCEGVSKAATGDKTVRELVDQARGSRVEIVVSAATLTEVLRGTSRDARIHRVLKWATIETLSPGLGKSAGQLLGRSRLPARCAIDAMVAATALIQERPVVILTSDPNDLTALVEGEKGVGVVHI